jgi:hypothetical protein
MSEYSFLVSAPPLGWRFQDANVTAATGGRYGVLSPYVELDEFSRRRHVGIIARGFLLRLARRVFDVRVIVPAAPSVLVICRAVVPNH